MQNIKWEFLNSKLNPEEINTFSKNNKIPYHIATVLLNRGIKTREELEIFIKKSLDSIVNPLLLPDIDVACERVLKAIAEKEKIVIYGDYDVDGITSTTLLYKFLKKQGADVYYYIPDRVSEGYSLSIMAINKLSKEKTKLIITVDCGIASFGEIELAKALGMDVIITDHHTCRQKLPQALAVINPKRADSSYPFKNLAGVGVCFKFVLALCIKLGLNTRDCFLEYSTLASIGTIADVVELKGENRVIVDKGLKNIQNVTSHGVKALLDISGVSSDKKINSSTVSYALSPRINAAGRMEHANIAANLLLCDNEEEAKNLSSQLDELNRKRQQIEKNIYIEALEMIKNDSDFDKKRIIVLAKDDWHHGVIGIVASKITETFYKPCILLSCDKPGILKGSGRSIEGINLFEALNSCEEHLNQFGGHSLAAGLSLNVSELENFIQSINNYIKENVPVMPQKTLFIDCSLPSSLITAENANLLNWLEPFGMDNERPVYALKRARILNISLMGTEQQHLKLIVESDKKTFEAVGFSFAGLLKYLKPDIYVDIAFNMDINEFRNQKRLQLIIKDIKLSS